MSDQVRRRVERMCAAGAVRTADLRRAGLSARQIAAAVVAGTLERIRIGVYVGGNASRALCSAVAHDGALTCLNRLALAGVWLLRRDDVPHVLVSRVRRRRSHDACVCVLHSRTRVPPRSGIDDVVGALAEVARCRSAEEFFVALESCMRLLLIDDAGRALLRRLVPSTLRAAVDDARWNADSGLESLLRFRLAPLGIVLASQVEIPGVGHVDFVLDDGVIFEIDGKANHDGPSERHRDLVRDAVAAAHGFRTLRFDYAIVVHDWDLVVAAVLGALDRDRRVVRAE